MARKNGRASLTRRLHRSLGVGAAGFIILMVLSGLAINHSKGLGFEQGHVSQDFLLDWYGLEEPEDIRSFAIGNDWLSFAGPHLYINGTPLADLSGGIGAISTDDMLIAAGNEELLLLDHDGVLIERLPWNLVGSGLIETIGRLADGKIVIRSAGQLWQADSQLLGWKLLADTTVTPDWSIPGPAPGELTQAIGRHYRGDGISLERLLLDLHSGRIFGPVGILVYDLLALAVGFLAISGLVFWLHGRRNFSRKDRSPQ